MQYPKFLISSALFLMSLCLPYSLIASSTIKITLINVSLNNPITYTIDKIKGNVIGPGGGNIPARNGSITIQMNGKKISGSIAINLLSSGFYPCKIKYSYRLLEAEDYYYWKVNNSVPAQCVGFEPPQIDQTDITHPYFYFKLANR